MLSLVLLKSMRLCWSDAQLEAAALSWPTVPTWAWFIGARVHTMARADVLARVSVVHAYALRNGVVFPVDWTRPRRLGAQYAAAKTMTDPELWAYCAELGAVVDTADEAAAAAAPPVTP